MSTYILLKRLPDGQVNEEYKWDEMAKRYANTNRNKNCMTLSKSWVEDNPEWFKLKDEKINKILTEDEMRTFWDFFCDYVNSLNK